MELDHPEIHPSSKVFCVAGVKPSLTRVTLIEDSLNELGVDKPEWKHDIFCPSTARAELAARFPNDTELVYPIHEMTEGY